MDEIRTSRYSNPNPYEAQNPVLLIAFNRPNETLKVINILRQVKPKRIFFAVDGPRLNRPGDDELVMATQKLLSAFDWDCIVSTRFLERNLGCGVGVSSAITWALTFEECVLVLEDDILPVVSFFRFCDELLQLYGDDAEVFAIAGCNFVPKELLATSESYRFSSIPNVWGWAVWKRSWDNYVFDLSDWRRELPMRDLRKSLGGSLIATIMWATIFDLMAAKKIDTWDYQLCYAVLKTKSKVATSNTNTITNIGFGSNSTHTVVTPNYLLEAEETMFPLKHPAQIINLEIDKWVQRNIMGASPVRLMRSAINARKLQRLSAKTTGLETNSTSSSR